MNKKCQVNMNEESGTCGNKAIAKIKDIVCSGLHLPFYVCRKHKASFLKGNHYELVKKIGRTK